MKTQPPRLLVPVLAILVLALAAPLAVADDCEYKRPLGETIDASGASRIDVEAGAGFLRVTGGGGGEVRARGEACASEEDVLGKIELVVERAGDRVRIRTEIPDGSWGRNRVARLDLEIEVPSFVALRVDDGSGSIEIRGVESLDLRDGSGSILIEDVAGSVEVADGSGELEIRGVRGEVRIKDGSGEIDVRDAGSVVIDGDGSGSIELAEIEGDVLVRSDGSGSITVAGVGGDFKVGRDGSGGIYHDRVAGYVEVPTKD